VTGFTHLHPSFLVTLLVPCLVCVLDHPSYSTIVRHTHTFYTDLNQIYTHTMSAYVKSCYPAGTPVFEPMSPVFEDRTHPASLTPCGIHNPALLELIRTDVSREMVCKFILHLSTTKCVY
jgi:hypothetical protein